MRAPLNTPRQGDIVRYTDPQGVTVTGRVQRVVLIRQHGNPRKVARRYYQIDGIGVLVSDGVAFA